MGKHSMGPACPSSFLLSKQRSAAISLLTYSRSRHRMAQAGSNLRSITSQAAWNQLLVMRRRIP
jgi:hypothetical protein